MIKTDNKDAFVLVILVCGIVLSPIFQYALISIAELFGLKLSFFTAFVIPALVVSLLPAFYAEIYIKEPDTAIKAFIATLILAFFIPFILSLRTGPSPQAVAYLTIPPRDRSGFNSQNHEWLEEYSFLPRNYNGIWAGQVSDYYIAIYTWRKNLFLGEYLCRRAFNSAEKELKPKGFEELNLTIQRKAYKKAILSNKTTLIYIECYEKLGYPRLIFLVGNTNKTEKFLRFIEDLR
ncbi:hypothetical protein E3E31_05530 [Thermococcus sp. M39]|uniref:hypothetical protein n=1 Tax=Thermococcus sp. M39 TaxID=1638262 RepID=UPI00143B2587|nr:hypothetical protein [Thermococcus sp. M39]NJE07987.1 hypothetical protein [Thermococcus sp. M39]